MTNESSLIAESFGIIVWCERAARREYIYIEAGIEKENISLSNIWISKRMPFRNFSRSFAGSPKEDAGATNFITHLCAGSLAETHMDKWRQ